MPVVRPDGVVVATTDTAFFGAGFAPAALFTQFETGEFAIQDQVITGGTADLSAAGLAALTCYDGNSGARSTLTSGMMGVAFGGAAMQTAIVKTATSQFAAECLSLVESRRRIREAAQAAVAGLRAGGAPKPFAVTRPTTLAVEFVYSRHADRALLFPGAARMAGTRVEVTLPDMLAAYRAFRAMATLARD